MSETDTSPESVVVRIISTTRKWTGQAIFHASTLSVLAYAFYTGNIDSNIFQVFGLGVGVNLLSDLIRRMAGGETISDNTIRREVEKALDTSPLGDLLTKTSFQRTLARLFERHERFMTSLIAESDKQVAKELLEQLEHYQLLTASGIWAIDERLSRMEKQDEELQKTVQKIAEAIPTDMAHFWDSDANASDEFDVNSYLGWVQQKANIVASAVTLTTQKLTTIPDILGYVIQVGSESSTETSDVELNLIDVLAQMSQITVVGESGSGKSTALWQVALHQCESLLNGIANEKVPVYIDLAGYSGESITDLIAQSFQAASLSISHQVIANLAIKGNLLLLFDDFDLAKTEYKSELLRLLKKWKTSHLNCSLTITTHHPHDGHRLGLPTFRIQPLSEKQAEQILSNFSELNHKDIVVILNSFSSESKHLIETPLTLCMVAYAYINSSDHRIPRSRGLLYREVIDGIMHLGEAKGAIEFERSDKILLMSLLARWMLNNETYELSPTQISELIDQWIHHDVPLIAHLRNSDPLRLRVEIFQSGFFQTTLNGNLQFAHSSYRNFFAALAISIEELDILVSKSNWHTSVLFWSSITNIGESDNLIEMLVNNPLLLAQVMRERTERRGSKKFDAAKENEYFDQLAQHFRKFVSQFSIITRKSSLEGKAENGIKLSVGKSSSNDYAVLWELDPNYDISSVEWINPEKLHEKASYIDDEIPFPLPIWLLPATVVQNYHPLEVVYLWVRRTLFDLLNFIGVIGGIDETQVVKGQDLHPAITLITNRYLLYQMMAGELPIEINKQLPFYAQGEYDLCIEIHDYMQPYVVHYAIMPARKVGEIAIIQSILRDVQEPTMFVRGEDGFWSVNIADESYSLASIETVQMPELMTQSAGHWATNQLMKELEQFLPGFPPEAW